MLWSPTMHQNRSSNALPCMEKHDTVAEGSTHLAAGVATLYSDDWLDERMSQTQNTDRCSSTGYSTPCLRAWIH